VQSASCSWLTPVHVNRTLKTLDAEGLITRQSSRSVTIGDWRKLAEAGDFNSTYLHLRDGEPALR
jgi:DNA-binding HxlR family transcriptional regulator